MDPVLKPPHDRYVIIRHCSQALEVKSDRRAKLGACHRYPDEY